MTSLCLIALTFFVLQEVEQTPERSWRTPPEISNQIIEVDESYDSVRTTTIGYSGNGLPIHCIEVANSGSVPIKDRSAVLIVAGIDGNHLLGTEVAIDLVTKLLSMDSDTTKPLFATSIQCIGSPLPE